MKRLPRVPSKLLELAVKDMKAIEKNPDYTIDMDDWHVMRKPNGTCSVCMAGAIMAQTLGVDRGINLSPWELHEDGVSEKLMAVDRFREGYIKLGVQTMCGTDKATGYLGPAVVKVTSYRRNPEDFYEDMGRVIQILKEHKL